MSGEKGCVFDYVANEYGKTKTVYGITQYCFLFNSCLSKRRGRSKYTDSLSFLWLGHADTQLTLYQWC